uniref:Uncharacterized protein n=1 Tax=Timema douglasi TaxID=61478 RepID=A0A7R8Z5A5_TIMDO|nr:unnamed protein product [Timema douglasi]
MITTRACPTIGQQLKRYARPRVGRQLKGYDFYDDDDDDDDVDLGIPHGWAAIDTFSESAQKCGVTSSANPKETPCYRLTTAQLQQDTLYTSLDQKLQIRAKYHL